MTMSASSASRRASTTWQRRKLRAALAQAVLAGRGDVRPQRVGIGEAAAARPGRRARWCGPSAGCAPACRAVGARRPQSPGAAARRAVDALEAVAAQIVAAALEQRHPRRAAEGRATAAAGPWRTAGPAACACRWRSAPAGPTAAPAPGTRKSCRYRCPPRPPGTRAPERLADALRHALLVARTLKSGSARARGPPCPNMSSRSNMSAGVCVCATQGVLRRHRYRDI